MINTCRSSAWTCSRKTGDWRPEWQRSTPWGTGRTARAKDTSSQSTFWTSRAQWSRPHSLISRRRSTTRFWSRIKCISSQTGQSSWPTRGTRVSRTITALILIRTARYSKSKTIARSRLRDSHLSIWTTSMTSLNSKALISLESSWKCNQRLKFRLKMEWGRRRNSSVLITPITRSRLLFGEMSILKFNLRLEIALLLRMLEYLIMVESLSTAALTQVNSISTQITNKPRFSKCGMKTSKEAILFL